MKTIILYIALALSLLSAGVLGYKNIANKATIAEQNRTIAVQREMIKELAQQEAIAIHITNEFKSNAVLGKVVVDANIRNVAEQCAAILKGELHPLTPKGGTPEIPLK
ncbi:hypothetical protein AGMMS4956_18330 [Bacteroidia bacterium]|nr:hypothetical protein AGMMS4956_18330 [Bacteroidia bacterium]